MRARDDSPDLYLIELADLEGDDAPAVVCEHREALERLVDWAEEFLWKPNPDLGRTGAVCPYAQTSMERGNLYMTVVPDRHVEHDEVRDLVLRYLGWFHDLEPRDQPAAQFKTILILFPRVPGDEAGSTIDPVQESLKHDFVARGLMIGQFHERSDEPGLWNDDFRPLRAPVPLLGIRHMVPTDFPFLRGDRRLMASYLERLGDQVPTRIQDQVADAARKLGLELPDALQPRAATVSLEER